MCSRFRPHPADFFNSLIEPFTAVEQAQSPKTKQELAAAVVVIERVRDAYTTARSSSTSSHAAARLTEAKWRLKSEDWQAKASLATTAPLHHWSIYAAASGYRNHEKYLLAAYSALALASNVTAASAQYDSETSWVLLGLDWENGGGVAVRDMPGLGQAHLFPTERACQAAMRRSDSEIRWTVPRGRGRRLLPLHQFAQLARG